jgi:hypothetical protein
MAEQRADVRIVGSSGSDVPVGAGSEPEAAPPVPAAPIEPPEPTLGGSPFPNPSEADVVAATGGGIAEQMRARFNSMSATEEFPVPGWETADGSPGLILVARTFGDRRNWAEGLANEVFIAKSTHKLLYVDDAGVRHEIPGGWGPDLAEMIGVKAAKAADLVAMVISKPDPSQPERRIPNVAGIGALATELIEWSRRATRHAEEDLGE